MCDECQYDRKSEVIGNDLNRKRKDSYSGSADTGKRSGGVIPPQPERGKGPGFAGSAQRLGAEAAEAL